MISHPLSRALNSAQLNSTKQNIYSKLKIEMEQKLSIAFFLASLMFLPFVFSASRIRAGTLVGGWQPIKNINDPHVKEIAEFAVSEHNKQSKAGLMLKSVVKGETQVVAGINYKLDLLTTDGADYEAVVWEKTTNAKTLISFKPIKA